MDKLACRVGNPPLQPALVASADRSRRYGTARSANGALVRVGFARFRDLPEVPRHATQVAKPLDGFANPTGGGSFCGRHAWRLHHSSAGREVTDDSGPIGRSSTETDGPRLNTASAA
jgi:hypothetical protein